MCDTESNIVSEGSYVILKKQDYSKVCKATKNGSIMIGKDRILINEIIGKYYWTTFEMIPVKGEKRTFSLKETLNAESWHDLKTALPSGPDNRTITDDGTSQKLSKEEILKLQESGKSGKEIVGTLIENSTSFVAKTEYSQEKYIKKKEKKYFKYLTIRKPTINSLHEAYFKRDQHKIGGLRADALSQLLSYCDVQADGIYILYDSGSQGLPAAAMLNRIGTNNTGRLINLHPGNVPQTALVQAMNFPKEQLDRMLTSNIYSFLRLHYQGESSVLSNISAVVKPLGTPSTSGIEEEMDNDGTSLNNLFNNSTTNESLVSSDIHITKDKQESDNCSLNKDSNNSVCNNPLKSSSSCTMEEKHKSDEYSLDNQDKQMDTCTTAHKNVNMELKGNDDNREESELPIDEGTLKRKLQDSTEEVPTKKPKWLLETQTVVDLLKETKARGLAIVAKEHPLNIVEALLPFLELSRPFVIFHVHREPLEETYVGLKQRQGIINLKLFSNFFRSYQVLPNRTHPDILMSDTGGYLLTGYLVAP